MNFATDIDLKETKGQKIAQTKPDHKPKTPGSFRNTPVKIIDRREQDKGATVTNHQIKPIEHNLGTERVHNVETERISQSQKNIQIPTKEKNPYDYLEKQTCLNLLRYSSTFYCQSMSLVFNLLIPNFLNIITYYFIRKYNNATFTGAFGLGNALYLFFFKVFLVISCEVAGFHCNQAYGAKNFSLMRISFISGWVFNTTLACFSTVVYCYIDTLLLACGFDEALVSNARLMLLVMQPAIFLQAVNDTIKVYIMTHKLFKQLQYCNIFVLCVMTPSSYLFLWKYQSPLIGFALLNILIEVIYLVIFLIVCYKYMPKESLGWKGLTNIPKSVKQHCSVFFSIVFGWYAEYMGIEQNTFFIGLTKNNASFTAWVCYSNYYSTIWSIGFGFANTIRTVVGLELGKKEINKAKTLSFMGLIYTFAYAFTLCFLLNFFRHEITSFYTTDKDVYDELYLMFTWEGVGCIFNGSSASFSTVLRIIGKTREYSIQMLTNQFIIWDSLSAFFLFILNMKGNCVVLASLITLPITIGICCVIVYKFNWDNIKIFEDKAEGDQLAEKARSPWTSVTNI